MTDKYTISLDWTKELVEAESFKTHEIRHWLDCAKSEYDATRMRTIIILYSKREDVIDSTYAMLHREVKNNNYNVVFTFPKLYPKYSLHVEFRGYEH